MENKKEELQKLKNRMAEIKPIVSKGFKTSKELQSYKKKNQTIYNEYYQLFKQIQQLEWELMTPEERKAEEETIEKMKLKREGKL